MWELCNRPLRVFGDTGRHPCATREDGRAFVQLRHLDEGYETLAIAWAQPEDEFAPLLDIAMALAAPLPISEIAIPVPERDASLFETSQHSRRTGTHEIWRVPVERA